MTMFLLLGKDIHDNNTYRFSFLTGFVKVELIIFTNKHSVTPFLINTQLIFNI